MDVCRAVEPFTEEAVQRGISYTADRFQNHGDGVAFADLDDDGDPDVVLLGANSEVVGIYENDGLGYFTDRSATSGIGLQPENSGVCLADYDRDQDLDVYITRRFMPNVLLRNDGDLQFSDVTAAAGVGDPGFGTGCTWGDYDNDGWVDLYAANENIIQAGSETTPNRLYHNMQDGTFAEVGVAMGVDLGTNGSFQASFFDFDRDADADLYVSAIRGFCDSFPYSRGHLYENTGGQFTDVTLTSGTSACGVDAMSVTLGDFDHNRYQDIYVTNVPPPPGNVLLANNGTGEFVHMEGSLGVASYVTGWGAVFFDFDNDTWQDLYVCNTIGTFGLKPNRLYHNLGPSSWPCADIAATVDVDLNAYSFAVASADVDGDGDLDLLVGSLFSRVRLYINHEGSERSWVKFDVVGQGANRYAVGARVDLRVGDVWQMREVIAGANYKSQDDLILHFGLANANVIDEIGVTWPGGTTRTLSNLPSSQVWRVYPPDKLGDANQDGNLNGPDWTGFVGCLGPVMTPGCEMMDFDGDSRVDLRDYAGLQLSAGQ